MLDVPAQGSCAVLGIIGRIHDGSLGGIGEDAGNLLVGQPLVEAGDLQVDDLGDVVLGQGLVEHHLVQTVQEFGTEGPAQEGFYLCPGGIVDGAVRVDAAEQILGTQIGGQDQDGILEVHGTALGIRDATIVQNLQEDVEDIGMGLLHFVEEHHGVGLPANGFRQLAAFLITHIAGRRTDQAGHGELLHILGHVDANHVGLVIEEGLGQSLGQLRLTHAGGAKEQEGTDGTVGVLDTGAAALDGLGDSLNSLILAHHTLVEGLIQVQ